MRKSIALFLTLIFITIIIGIIGALFTIYQKFIQDNFYKEISQNSLLIKNTKSILDKISKDINGSNIKILFKTFPISSKNGNFRALISIKPMFDRVDINEINKNDYVKKYLENILEYYQVANPILFENLILDTIDLDKKERMGGSEIVLNNPFFKQGKIYNYSHFKEILDYYFHMMNDKSVYKIPWQKLFIFGNGNSMIDCNLISKNVMKFLDFPYSNNINCQTFKNFQNKQKIQQLNIMPFNKNINYLIKINILYNDMNISFIYNLHTKKILKLKSDFIF